MLPDINWGGGGPTVADSREQIRVGVCATRRGLAAFHSDPTLSRLLLVLPSPDPYPALRPMQDHRVDKGETSGVSPVLSRCLSEGQKVTAGQKPRSDSRRLMCSAEG